MLTKLQLPWCEQLFAHDRGKYIQFHLRAWVARSSTGVCISTIPIIPLTFPTSEAHSAVPASGDWVQCNWYLMDCTINNIQYRTKCRDKFALAVCSNCLQQFQWDCLYPVTDLTSITLTVTVVVNTATAPYAWMPSLTDYCIRSSAITSRRVELANASSDLDCTAMADLVCAMNSNW